VSEIKRKKNESFEAFMRRTKQKWQQSGRILEARKGQYFTTQKNKNARKKSALASMKLKGQMEYKRKTGKLSKKELAEYAKRAGK
jgi:ribosomal protein S21